ncbi:hypothetical protein ANO11243_052750 [Dothideomycetidae sp. 11243]|nr:hypothetical protein ANO11243_052750 [fungal sp. No.11243]
MDTLRAIHRLPHKHAAAAAALRGHHCHASQHPSARFLSAWDWHAGIVGKDGERIPRGRLAVRQLIHLGRGWTMFHGRPAVELQTSFVIGRLRMHRRQRTTHHLRSGTVRQEQTAIIGTTSLRSVLHDLCLRSRIPSSRLLTHSSAPPKNGRTSHPDDLMHRRFFDASAVIDIVPAA